MGQATQEVLDKTVNLLRKRAGMPPMVISSLVKDQNSAFPEIPVLLDEIRRERRVELAIEGLRFEDLVRWKAGNIFYPMANRYRADVRLMKPRTIFCHFHWMNWVSIRT